MQRFESLCLIASSNWRFETVDAPGFDVHLRLVVELELPPLDGGSQLVLERQTRHNLGVLLEAEMQMPLAARPGVAQSCLGVLDERGRFLTVFGIKRQS